MRMLVFTLSLLLTAGFLLGLAGTTLLNGALTRQAVAIATATQGG